MEEIFARRMFRETRSALGEALTGVERSLEAGEVSSQR